MRDKSALTTLVVVKVIRFLKYILKVITGFLKDLMWGCEKGKKELRNSSECLPWTIGKRELPCTSRRKTVREESWE